MYITVYPCMMDSKGILISVACTKIDFMAKWIRIYMCKGFIQDFFVEVCGASYSVLHEFSITCEQTIFQGFWREGGN